MPTHINVTPAFHRHQLMVLGRYRGIIHVPTGFKNLLYLWLMLSCLVMLIHVCVCVLSICICMSCLPKLSYPLSILVTIRFGRHGLVPNSQSPRDLMGVRDRRSNLTHVCIRPHYPTQSWLDSGNMGWSLIPGRFMTRWPGYVNVIFFTFFLRRMDFLLLSVKSMLRIVTLGPPAHGDGPKPKGRCCRNYS